MSDMQKILKDAVGKPIGQSVVWRLLRNEHYYIGHYLIQDIEVPAPPIIDRETFEEAARHFKTSRHNAAGRANVDYLLSCKCHCELCGKMLQGVSGRGKLGTIYHYYKCPERKCSMKPVRKDYLEDFVVRHTCEDILTEEMIGKLTKKIMEIQESNRDSDPAAALRKELKELKKKQRNIIEAIENGAGISLVGRLNEIDERIGDLSLEIERAELQRPLIPEEYVHSWLMSFRNGEKNDQLFRKRLISTFVADVIVGPEYVTIVYNTNEKEPYTGVCVRPSEWDERFGTRTLTVIGNYIVLRISRK